MATDQSTDQEVQEEEVVDQIIITFKESGSATLHLSMTETITPGQLHAAGHYLQMIGDEQIRQMWMAMQAQRMQQQQEMEQVAVMMRQPRGAMQ